MTFLDPKERVIDLQITPYGKYLMSVGRFKPALYAFFDDDILYDRKFAASGTNEAQNDIEPRIQEETPRLSTQAMYRGTEIGLFSTNPNLVNDLMPGVLADKKNDVTIQETPNSAYILANPLGTSAYNSDKLPAWSINFLKAELSGSSPVITGSIPTTFIPQLRCNIESTIYKYPKDDSLYNQYYSDEGGLMPTEVGDSEIYDDQIVFLDGTSITYNKDFIMLQVEEANAEFLKDNFEVEVYEILDTTGSGPYGEKNPETLKRLYFEDDLLGVGADDPKYVEYYFDIQVDNEIDSEEFCSLKIKNNKIESIYVDDTFVCPDKIPSPTVSLNIYGTKENQDIEVC